MPEIGSAGKVWPTQSKLFVFPESKEFLAGYWIVKVETPEQACALAAKASTAPGPSGAPMNMTIEVREVLSAPPREFL
jgi:hypothetical protein